VAPCQNCISGKYSLQQAVTCADCPIGRFYGGTQGNALSVCENCGRGKYADSTGSTGCSVCKDGTYDPCSTGSPSGPCDGEKPGHTKEQDCTVCPSGKYSLMGDANRNACTDCLAGKYLSDNSPIYTRRTEHSAASKCLDCLEGDKMG
jgi:hypothetical protein